MSDARPPIEQLAARIESGETLTDSERVMVSAVIRAVGQQFYEKSGSMFISGVAGDVDSNGMPERLFVAAAFGVSWSYVYERTEKTIGR